jgi:catechol 2,3-dioxygenase-like lactoylglutathione lyase family enzyme
MKRFHVHVGVDDLAASIRFYNTLFASQPVIVRDDYAKWMLEDPRVNFAISKRSDGAGIGHLGIQVENRSELADVYSRLQRANAPVLEEGRTSCCYSISEKSWIADPQGIRWETFYTTGDSADHCSVVPGDGRASECCGPAKPAGRTG